MNLQDRFDGILDRLFPGGGKVLLAVSGGVDSVCMFDLFRNYKGGLRFGVAHCNFHLRGAESDSDETFVEDLCRSAGLEFHKADFDTRARASACSESIEMAARELRYSWFRDVCAGFGYDAVAVAHNANDNSETMILNMLRGTGISGMLGMKEVSVLPVPGCDIPLVRPLLSFSREEIMEYAAARGLSWHEDRTNSENEYKRNKVRNQVFQLFGEINPAFLAGLGRDMRNLGQVAAISDDYFSWACESVVRSCGPDGSVYSIPALKALKHRDFVLFRLLGQYGFSPSDAASLSRILDNGGTLSGRMFMAGGWQVLTSSDEIIVRKYFGSVPNETITVEGPGSYVLGGRKFDVEVRPYSSEIPLRQPVGTIIADARSFRIPFLVRHWEKGDWMIPLGLHGRKKLSDMFVDLKFSIPEKERALVAVVPGMNRGEGPVRVASLLGYRIDETMKVGPETKEIVIVYFHE